MPVQSFSDSCGHSSALQKSAAHPHADQDHSCLKAVQIAEALGAEKVPKSIVDEADYPEPMRPERRFVQRTAEVTRCRFCHYDGHYRC